MAKAFRRFGLASSSPVPVDVVKTNVVPTLSSADAKKFGLENFGNNCYANSVIQALYFCTPFRDLMLQSPDSSLPSIAPQSSPVPPVPPATPLAPVRRKPERKQSTTSAATSVPEPVLPPAAPIPNSPPSLFSALRSLFLYISTHPQERGTVSPRVFVEKLKEVNRAFDTTTHQDAHEFLNYLLNKIVEEVEEERKDRDVPEDLSNSVTTLQSQAPSSGCSPHHSTFVHRLFEGVLTSETRCLTCETVSSRDESFLDLSIDIEQNSSVTACLRQFSASEMLCHKNKFFCDSCCDLQEAEKRMKIKRLPNVLALHLKRFKYQEESQRFVKLAYRVAFPFELRLFNTVDEMDDADRLYNLFGIVVHIGNGPHHGHYVSIVKTLGTWLLFDDENVTPISESEIPKYFGDVAPAAGCAYVLYYQAANIDMGKLGIRPEQVEELRNTAIAELSQPTHPPGLTPEDPIPVAIPTQSEPPEFVSPFSAPLSSSPPSIPPTQSIPIPTPPPSSLRTSISTSASSSHSHTQQRSTDRQPPSSKPPTAPPLISSLSSPAPAKPTTGNIFSKAIRRTPSISIRTSVGQNSGGGGGKAVTTPTAATHNPPPVPPTPTWVLVNGAEATPESPTSSSTANGKQQPNPNGRPVTAHGRSPSHGGNIPRALPMPPRPTTSGDPGGEREREREKEKEGGWGKWFGGGGGRTAEPTLLVNGVVDGDAAKGMGSGGSVEGEGSSGEVDPNTSTSSYLNGSANGVALPGSKRKEKEHKEKEKDKGRGTWFTKRKSFRLGGEKPSKGSAVPSTPDVEQFGDSSSRTRSSLQLPQRRASESGGGQATAPPMSGVRSTPGMYEHDHALESSPKHRSRQVSTSQKLRSSTHLHPQDYTLENSEVSPTPSSTSSVDSGGPSLIPPAPPSPHHKSSVHQPQLTFSRPHDRNVTNGRPPRSQTLAHPPAPRMYSSMSTPPSAPPTKEHQPLPSAPISPHTRPRTLPAVPHSPAPSIPPPTPERKKSITNFPVFRGREKERDKEPGVIPRPSTAGAEVGWERERPLPLPPVPVPVSDTVELRTHHHYHYQQPPQDTPHHQRQTSVFGGAEVEEPMEEAPGLGTFGSANTSATSSAGNGSGNTGFKRATRKLSLTAPMLGFGKRDKDREKSKEKVAPSSFMRV